MCSFPFELYEQKTLQKNPSERERAGNDVSQMRDIYKKKCKTNEYDIWNMFICRHFQSYAQIFDNENIFAIQCYTSIYWVEGKKTITNILLRPNGLMVCYL